MNVLSLFDGMSCGQIALERAGIKIDNYFASEIDKYAMQVAKKNYPNMIHLPGVEFVSKDMLQNYKIDLLIGGSPCQGFSFAGKQLNFDDPRSKLFFEYVRLLKELKPKYFLLENVRMKKEYLKVITDQLGVEPILINSSLVSGQNRLRYYWTNIPNIEQPKDKGILLKDVLEDSSNNITIMSEKFCNRNKNILRDDFNGKSKCLSAMEYVKNGRQGDYIKVDSSHFISQKGIDYMYEEVNGINRWKKYPNKINGKSGTIATNVRYPNGILKYENKFNEKIYRKLTPIECERLQTVPDDYTEGVSNTQRYKMLGNGWTVDVIAHIFKNIK